MMAAFITFMNSFSWKKVVVVAIILAVLGVLVATLDGSGFLKAMFVILLAIMAALVAVYYLIRFLWRWFSLRRCRALALRQHDAGDGTKESHATEDVDQRDEQA
jgi:hypothetical protein